MSIRPSGKKNGWSVEQLVMVNLAGLIVVGGILIIGGTIVAAVIQEQTKSIEGLTARVNLLESNHLQAKNTKPPTQPKSPSNAKSQASDPAPPARSVQSSRFTPPRNKPDGRNEEQEIIKALRDAMVPDAYGRATASVSAANKRLVRRLVRAADDDLLAPRVLARGATLALLLDNTQTSQKLLKQAEAGGASTAAFYEAFARKEIAEGNTESAIIAATRMADQTNNSPAALVLLATAQRLRDEPGPLVGTLSFGGSWQNLLPPDQLLLAHCWADAGDSVMVRSTLESLPDNLAEPLAAQRETLLAMADVLEGNSADALTTLQSLDPEQKRYEVTVWVGRALLDLNRRDEARAAFSAATLLEPSRAAGHYWLGQMAMNEEQREAAEQHFQQAVAVGPLYAYAWEGWGTLALNMKQLELALERLTNAIEAAPHLASPHYILAIAFAKAERKEPAAEALQQAIARDPSIAQRARLTQMFQRLFGEELEAVLNTPAPVQ